MARPTRQGSSTVLVAFIAFGIGRVFGIGELYIIGAALALLVVGAWLVVGLRADRLDITRTIYPRMVAASTNGNVRVDIRNRDRVSSPVVDLHDPIGTVDSADIQLGQLQGDGSIAAAYQVPTSHRGIIEIGPMRSTRTDPFRLARRTRTVAPTDVLKVTPKTFPLAPPNDSTGPLGTRLRAASQRLGNGDFHSLRDYVPGDELRSIHWKASARSDDLKVKQYERQHLERCTVILDLSSASYGSPDAYRPDSAAPKSYGAAGDPNSIDSTRSQPSTPAFERAISCAASIVAACHLGDLNTQFLAGRAIDHRGPDVLSATLTSLASVAWEQPTAEGIEPSSPVVEPSDGLSLIVVVSATPASAASLLPRRRDPATTHVFVCVDAPGDAWNALHAPTASEFQDQWNAMVGHPTVDHPSSPRPSVVHDGLGVGAR